jgi:hypothetical protein
VSPQQSEEGYPDYKYVGPVPDTVDVGVVGELKNILDTIKQAKAKAKAKPKAKAKRKAKRKSRPSTRTEGIITSPATILVNGTPFKLRFGDRLIADNVKGIKSKQK